MSDRDQPLSTSTPEGDDGVILHDSNGIIVATNENVLSLLGFSEAELLGLSLKDIQPDKLRNSDIIKNQLELNDSDEKVETRSTVFQRKDGSRFPAVLKSSNIKFFQNGESVQYTQRIIRTQVADKKRSEDEGNDKQHANDAAKSDRSSSEGISFLEILKREMSSPVEEMLSAIRLIEQSTPDQAHKALLSLTLRSGSFLIELIQDILELCRVDMAKVTMSPHRFNFAQLVDDLFEQITPEANKKRIHLTSYIDSSIPNYCYGDEARIRLVITKILKNAFALTEEGSIRFEVRMTNDNRVRFEVLDTGCGITEEQQAIIFREDIFKENLIDKNYSAVAVGYALAKKMIKLMNGHIGCSSLSGSGTLIWFALDIIEENTLSEENQFLAGKSIVCIDALDETRRPLVKQLQSWGAEVAVFDQEESAIQFFQKGGVVDPESLHELSNPTLIKEAGTSDSDAEPLKVDVVMMYVHESNQHHAGLIRSINEYLTDLGHEKDTDLVVLSPGYLTPDAARHFARIKHTPLRCPYKASKLGNKLACLLKLPEPFEVEADLKDESVGAEGGADALSKSGASEGQFVQTKEKKQYSGSILIVDDGKITQMITAKFLRGHGFTVCCANNGWDAILQTEKRYFDLILMDVNMPDMDGIEATQRIRQAEQHMRHTPILAITASMDKNVWKRCMFAGMDDYMTKPIDNQVMLSTLEYWLTADDSENVASSSKITTNPVQSGLPATNGNAPVLPPSSLSAPVSNPLSSEPPMRAAEKEKPCINLEKVEVLQRDIDQEMLPEVVNLFLNEMSQKVTLLSDIVAAGDAGAAMGHLSEIETECLYMGAEWIQAIATDLALFLEKQDFEQCRTLLEKMPSVIGETSDNYKKILANGAHSA